MTPAAGQVSRLPLILMDTELLPKHGSLRDLLKSMAEASAEKPDVDLFRFLGHGEYSDSPSDRKNIFPSSVQGIITAKTSAVRLKGIAFEIGAAILARQNWRRLRRGSSAVDVVHR